MINQNEKLPLLIISGATATGKTEASLMLGHFLGNRVEIVNFDSLLFYYELNIGTAKPSLAERSSIPHHLIDIHSIKKPLTAADFYSLALTQINTIHNRGGIPLLVGGSGFYLQTLLKGMYHSPAPTKEIREQSQRLYLEEGISPFLKILENQDPDTYRALHPNDHYRLRRAVEHYWAHKTPFSAVKKNFNSALAAPHQYNWHIHHIYLDMPKQQHQLIIEQRTAQMLRNGLIEEVTQLQKNPAYSGEERPLRSIGYLQVAAYLRGDINSLSKCQESINIATRQLAKAQRTWFKKITEKKCYLMTESSKIQDDVQEFMQNTL